MLQGAARTWNLDAIVPQSAEDAASASISQQQQLSYVTHRTALACIGDVVRFQSVQVGGCDADLTEEDVEAGEVDQLAARLTNTVVQVRAAVPQNMLPPLK